jgi:hypothetical protein
MAMQLERAMVQEKEPELATLSELATAQDSALVWAHLSEWVMALEWELEPAMMLVLELATSLGCLLGLDLGLVMVAMSE